MQLGAKQATDFQTYLDTYGGSTNQAENRTKNIQNNKEKTVTH